MQYHVYVKDTFGKFWTVVVKANNTRLADIFEYAKYKTFGGEAIGLKEVLQVGDSDHQHGDVYSGMI